MEISQHPNTQVRPMTKYDPTVASILEGTIFNEMEKGMSAEDALELLTTEVLSRLPELKRA